jgi:hypothetical protein
VEKLWSLENVGSYNDYWNDFFDLNYNLTGSTTSSVFKPYNLVTKRLDPEIEHLYTNYSKLEQFYCRNWISGLQTLADMDIV